MEDVKKIMFGLMVLLFFLTVNANGEDFATNKELINTGFDVSSFWSRICPCIPHMTIIFSAIAAASTKLLF